MWSRPWRRRGKTAASRSMAGNHRNCGGQVIHSLPAAGLRGRLRSAMNNLGHGIRCGAQREQGEQYMIPFPTLFITEQSAREGGEARL